MKKKTSPIETREHLLSFLAEAAELEHSLMCLYLYAAFSLKRETDEGLSPDELAAVTRWRQAIVDVAVQEMSHLALVSNLTTAVGGTPHFYRPAFPVRPGYYPSDFVVELAPFSKATIEHFIFLERPESRDLEPSPGFEPERAYVRGTARDRLLAHAGDYETVGALYEAIEAGIVRLSRELGEKRLFCGSTDLQLSQRDVSLEGMAAIDSEEKALRAIRVIVEQGEGARSAEGSHFAKFQKVADELAELSRKNPSFEPARCLPRNPATRRPVEAKGVVWIEPSHAASLYVDLGNAIYGLMLRILVQLYAMESRSPHARSALLESAFTAMHALARAADIAGLIDFVVGGQNYRGALTFEVNRHFTPYELRSEKILLVERIEEIIAVTRELLGQAPTKKIQSGLTDLLRSLDGVRNCLERAPLGD